MKKPTKNILDTVLQSLEDDLTITDSTRKTYWNDLAVIMRSILANNDNETLIKWVHSQGYSGNSYLSVLNRLRAIIQEETNE
jgi:hypothetical protein